MNIFNQNYHIQIHTQVEKKKKKKKLWVHEEFYGKTISEYIISLKILIIDFYLK